jgi:putative acetyltransferase
MRIRAATADDREAMFEVWWQSVTATHDFVADEDLQALRPMVREYLASSEPTFHVLETTEGDMAGFIGLSGNHVDALFLAPAQRGLGGGTALLAHAGTLLGELTVDVNEQNTSACRFYAARGFVVTGRSERDGTGRPYPLLHMRLGADAQPR